MNTKIEFLKLSLKDNPDFITRELETGTKSKIYLAFFESLVNSDTIDKYVVKNVTSHLNLHNKIKEIKPLIGGPKLTTIKKDEEMFYYIENGFTLIIYKKECYAIETKAELDRGITISQTEPNMYGPKDSFCENYQKNMGVIKRRIKNKNLRIEAVDRGIYTKTKLGVIYIEDKVNKDALKKVKKILNKYKDYEVTDSHDLVQELRTDKIFPTILKTEKPSMAAKFLLKGYIVISIDNTPFSLVIDAKMEDFINPFTTDDFVKILRFVCLILNILTPALYIALINFNQEAIPSSLLINFSTQRHNVPFPAIVEAFLMMIICELLRESDIRFPSNYGSSTSILGALILGEAAVSAGFVSPIMIIIVAISFVSGLIFTDIRFSNALRVIRYSFLLISAFLGLYGLSIAIITTISIISNIKLHEGNYL